MLNGETTSISIEQVRNYAWSVASMIRQEGNTEIRTVCAVYLAYICLTKDIDASSLEDYIGRELDENRQFFLKENFGDDYSVIKDVIEISSLEMIRAYMIDYQSFAGRSSIMFMTPTSLVALANRFLEIQANSKVADFGCGIGNFVCKTALEKKSECFGVDIHTHSVEIARIRAEVLSLTSVEIEQNDMFALNEEIKFDRIFSNYPFGMRLKGLQGGNEYLQRLYDRIPGVVRITSSDWVYNCLLIDHLSDDGKAVAIMSNGSTWNTVDERIRSHFVQSGLIEAVIELPTRLFEETSIGTSLVVFSRGNKEVRFIDARDIFVKGRRQNEFSDENIESIYGLMTQTDDRARSVGFDEIKSNDYVLNPSRYLGKPIEVKNGVPFGDLIKKMTRGAQIKASDLDELASDAPTDTQYLMLAHIQNGMIQENLPFLEPLDDKYSKYYIHDKNLLMSKNGMPYKVTIAEVKSNQKILANGNMFVIELDEDKVNPYYIKAFFNTETGRSLLRSISVGSSIPNISATALKSLVVPLPDKEEQDRLASAYCAKEDEIKVLEYKLNKAKSDLENIFEED